MANFQNSPCYSARFVAALSYAADIHSHQIRKQGNIPYISHLLQVCGLVMEAGGNEDEAIAALLHDAIEDIEILPESLIQSFGSEVYSIVVSVSENKMLPKEKRKQGYINEIARQDIENWRSVQLVSFCDKLHNLRSYSFDGRNLWKSDTAEFYSQLFPIYESCDRIPAHMLDEMARLLDHLDEPGYPTRTHRRKSSVILSHGEFSSLWSATCEGLEWQREFGA